jgi:hypothetical protein
LSQVIPRLEEISLFCSRSAEYHFLAIRCGIGQESYNREKNVSPGDLTLISTCTLNSTERRKNLIRVYIGLRLIGRITLKNDSSEASLVTSLC